MTSISKLLMTQSKQPAPLVGEDLIRKVKELEHLSKEDKAKACGYYTTTKNGIERVNMMKFLNALMDAEGIELDSHSENKRRGGRTASYRLTVQSNGNLLIGSAYTEKMGCSTGDEFEITLGRRHIYLKKIEKEQEPEVEEVSSAS